MASAFSHAAAALVIGKLAPFSLKPAKFWWLSIGCSLLPDADVLGLAFGVPYGDMFGHRGLTHSLVFACLLSIVVVESLFRAVERGSRRWWQLITYFFIVTASHGILDAMTDGGLGVAFLAPFDNSRYFFPWRPVMVSPIGVAPFFSRYGLNVLLSEVVWIWAPLVMVLLMVKVFARVGTSR